MIILIAWSRRSPEDNTAGAGGGLGTGRESVDKSWVVIVRGNPGVFQLYPYPTLQKPLPLSRVGVFGG
jgi:hypothetical protein